MFIQVKILILLLINRELAIDILFIWVQTLLEAAILDWRLEHESLINWRLSSNKVHSHLV